jgi:hypothetical protein
MSAFRTASRVLLEVALQCPGCQTVNVPGATPALEYDGVDHVYCTVCSRSGPLGTFLPPSRVVAATN